MGSDTSPSLRCKLLTEISILFERVQKYNALFCTDLKFLEEI